MITKLTDLPAYPSQFPSVGARWRESAKRYAMLSGAWYQHLARSLYAGSLTSRRRCRSVESILPKIRHRL